MMITIAHWYHIKGPIIIFHSKGRGVKLKCVDNKNFFYKNMIFAKKKKAFLKLENIHNFDTYFHPPRNIVLKLFDDKCKAKACEIVKF